jgi:hypothetical protein
MQYRHVWAFLMALMLFVIPSAATAAEADTDRPGGDYSSFTIAPFSGDEGACESACARDGRCRAWTFVRGRGPSGGQCFLKDSVPAPRTDDCCVSGTSAAGGPGGGPGGGGGGPRAGITIYEDTRYGGGSQTYNEDVPNLVTEGWNDMISSFRIRGGGSWEVCRDTNYRGPCRTFANDQDNLVSISWNDQISSFRRVADVGPGGPGGPGDGPGWGVGPGMRDGVDRPGGDYRDFEMRRGDGGPAGCQRACADDNACRAWAFKRGDRFGDPSRCFLKGVVTAERPDRQIISGVSTNRDTIVRGMEDNTDRPGSDYRDFDLTAPDPRQCQQACERDRSCRAWTYVRPGAQTDQPRCYLKTPAPGATRDNCCVSGVTAFVPPPPPPGVGGVADNTRRDGSYFSDFRTVDGPSACETACRANSRCADWTYSKPGRPGRPGRCYLFRPGSTSVPDACCVSSRRGGGGGGGREVIGPGMRDNTDRPGFDLRPAFLLPAPNPELCRAACFEEFGCRAWVYSRPGTRAPRATCTLKSVPGPSRSDTCCVTGGRSSLF